RAEHGRVRDVEHLRGVPGPVGGDRAGVRRRERGRRREDQGHPVLVLPRRRGRGRPGRPLAGDDRGPGEGRRQAPLHRVPVGRARLLGPGLRDPRTLPLDAQASEEEVSSESPPAATGGLQRFRPTTPQPRFGVPPMSNQSVNRRAFLATSAAAGAAFTLPATSYAKVVGANEKVRIGFLGTGGRCQQHIDAIVDMRDEGKPVEPFGVCDVWDGDETLGKRTNDKKNRTGRGLYPSAKTCGIPMDAGNGRVSKDYRTILANKDVD